MILLRFRGSNQTQPNATKQSLINSCRITRTHTLFFVSTKAISPPSEPQFLLLLICNYMYVLTGVFSPINFSLILSLSLLENFLSLLFLPLYIHIYVHIYLYVSQGILSLFLSLYFFSFIFPFVFSLYISNYL